MAIVRFSIVVACFLLAIVGSCFAQPSDVSPKRVALIIGNAVYGTVDRQLTEPVNDARDMADQLRQMGFEVTVGENLTATNMQESLNHFYEEITSGSVVVFFFSGYGIQSNGSSYLIPSNGNIYTEAELRHDGFSLDSILAEINRRDPRAQIGIVDASRWNPFERRFRKVPRGLAPAVAPKNSLVMYSAGLGSLIDDGGTGHSLFVGELLKQIRANGVSAKEAFERTQMNVARASQNAQVPWLSSLLIEPFSFTANSSPSARNDAPRQPGETPRASEDAAKTLAGSQQDQAEAARVSEQQLADAGNDIPALAAFLKACGSTCPGDLRAQAETRALSAAGYDYDALSQIRNICDARCADTFRRNLQNRFDQVTREQQEYLSALNNADRLRAYVQGCKVRVLCDAAKREIQQFERAEVRSRLEQQLAAAGDDVQALADFLNACGSTCPDDLRGRAQTRLQTARAKAEAAAAEKQRADAAAASVATAAAPAAPSPTAPPPETAKPSDPCAAAEAHWRSTESIKTLEAYRDHLARFPNCAFAGLARARINAFSAPPPIASLAPPPPPRRPSLLSATSLSRWAIGAAANCTVPAKTYSLQVGPSNIVWQDGVGNIDVESIDYNGETEARTTTVRSVHQSGRTETVGTTWTYSYVTANLIQISRGGGPPWRIARCQ